MTKGEATVAVKRLTRAGWQKPEVLQWYGGTLGYWGLKDGFAVAAVGPTGRYR